jgi:hypothetical protein
VFARSGGCGRHRLTEVYNGRSTGVNNFLRFRRWPPAGGLFRCVQ